MRRALGWVVYLTLWPWVAAVQKLDDLALRGDEDA